MDSTTSISGDFRKDLVFLLRVRCARSLYLLLRKLDPLSVLLDPLSVLKNEVLGVRVLDSCSFGRLVFREFGLRKTVGKVRTRHVVFFLAREENPVPIILCLRENLDRYVCICILKATTALHISLAGFFVSTARVPALTASVVARAYMLPAALATLFAVHFLCLTAHQRRAGVVTVNISVGS